MDKKTFKITSGKLEGQEFTIDDIVFEGEEDFIEEESLNEITKFFDEVDKVRHQILEMVEKVSKLPSGEYGPPKQLQVLYDLKKRLNKSINFFQVDIPDIANVKFIHSKKLNDTHNLLVPDDYKISDRTLREREQSVKWYENQLQKYLSYQLKSLKTDLETYISQLNNIQNNPNIEDWYPELAEKNDPRIKYHSHKYWDTAFDLYYSKDYLKSKGAVYDYMVERMEELNVEVTLKKSSFKQIWKKENKKRAGGNNVTDEQ